MTALHRVALLLICSIIQAQQAPSQTQVGLLTRVASGEEYLGTYQESATNGNRAAAVSIPVVRTDQVYVITGGGMEYVVAETARVPAHVIVNKAIPYRTVANRFYFGDEEGREHQARIIRQTLIDPSAEVRIVPSRWKSVSVPQHFYARWSADSFYAENLVGKKEKAWHIVFEAKWNGREYVGNAHWTDKKCALSEEIDVMASAERIEGNYLFPPEGAKLNRKTCRYDKMQIFPITWVPE